MSEQPDLTRRTVLAGAAWSVPVVALAVATPAAAASATVTVTFVATYIELRRSDTFAALIAITNDSDTAAAPETLQVSLTGLPTSEDDFDVEFPDSATMADDQNSSLTVDNTAFVATDPSTGSIVITSESPIALAAHQTVVIGLYFRRPARNPTRRIFVIAGSFSFGTTTGAVSGTTVELTDEPG